METVLMVEAITLLLFSIFLMVTAACQAGIMYTLWLERTGGLPTISRAFQRKQKFDPDADVPEGMRGFFKFWVNDQGKKELLPVDEVEALEEERMEKLMAQEEDMANKYVDGFPLGAER